MPRKRERDKAPPPSSRSLPLKAYVAAKLNRQLTMSHCRALTFAYLGFPPFSLSSNSSLLAQGLLHYKLRNTESQKGVRFSQKEMRLKMGGV